MRSVTLHSGQPPDCGTSPEFGHTNSGDFRYPNTVATPMPRYTDVQLSSSSAATCCEIFCGYNSAYGRTTPQACRRGSNERPARSAHGERARRVGQGCSPCRLRHFDLDPTRTPFSGAPNYLQAGGGKALKPADGAQAPAGLIVTGREGVGSTVAVLLLLPEHTFIGATPSGRRRSRRTAAGQSELAATQTSADVIAGYEFFGGSCQAVTMTTSEYPQLP